MTFLYDLMGSTYLNTQFLLTEWRSTNSIQPSFAPTQCSAHKNLLQMEAYLAATVGAKFLWIRFILSQFFTSAGKQTWMILEMELF